MLSRWPCQGRPECQFLFLFRCCQHQECMLECAPQFEALSHCTGPFSFVVGSDVHAPFLFYLCGLCVESLETLVCVQLSVRRHGREPVGSCTNIAPLACLSDVFPFQVALLHDVLHDWTRWLFVASLVCVHVHVFILIVLDLSLSSHTSIPIRVTWFHVQVELCVRGSIRDSWLSFAFFVG